MPPASTITAQSQPEPMNCNMRIDQQPIAPLNLSDISIRDSNASTPPLAPQLDQISIADSNATLTDLDINTIKEELANSFTSSFRIDDVRSAMFASLDMDDIKPDIKSQTRFPCAHCPQFVFSCNKALKAHMRRAHGAASSSSATTLPFICPECGFAYNHRVSLDYHRVTQHSVKLGKHVDYANNVGGQMESFMTTPKVETKYEPEAGPSMPIAPKNEISPTLLLPQNPERRDFRCPKCPSLKFTAERYLKAHNTMKHYKRSPMRADEINLDSTVQAPYQNNIKMEIGTVKREETSIKCPYCDSSFATTLGCKIHQSRRHPNQPCVTVGGEDAMLKCQFCEVRCLHPHGLNMHQKNKHPEMMQENSSAPIEHSQKTVEKLKLSKCPQCPKVFKSKKWMMSHLFVKHKVTMPDTFMDIKWPMASTSTADPSFMFDAQNESNGSVTFKTISCDMCNQQFDNVFNWMKHKREKHQSDVSESDLRRPFECLVCGMTFKSHKKLMRHHKHEHAAGLGM